MRIKIGTERFSRLVRLPEIPRRGERIALPDGTRLIVSNVEQMPPGTGAINAEVRARPAS